MTLLALASTQRAIAIVVLVVALLLWLGYLVLENRRTTTDIVDSFLDAPNRKNPPIRTIRSDITRRNISRR